MRIGIIATEDGLNQLTAIGLAREQIGDNIDQLPTPKSAEEE